MRINVTKTQIVLHGFCPEASVTKKCDEAVDYLEVSTDVKHISPIWIISPSLGVKITNPKNADP